MQHREISFFILFSYLMALVIIIVIISNALFLVYNHGKAGKQTVVAVNNETYILLRKMLKLLHLFIRPHTHTHTAIT